MSNRSVSHDQTNDSHACANDAADETSADYETDDVTSADDCGGGGDDVHSNSTTEPAVCRTLHYCGLGSAYWRGKAARSRMNDASRRTVHC